MYNCTFVADSGYSFYFGYENGVLFDVDPLSELDVNISTSQGFLQVGDMVVAETVNGVSREIKGVFVDYSDTTLPWKMIDVFAPGTHGNLYFNDEYYCECVVKKAPAIQLKNRKRTFSLMLFSPYPYWISVTSEVYVIGLNYEAAFEFPVCYDEHTFGIRSEDTITTVTNSGNIDLQISIEFTSTVEVSYYGIIDVNTGDYLQINDTLETEAVVNAYWEKGSLRVQKTYGGETTDILALLDEGSTLFSVSAGENEYQVYDSFGSGIDSYLIAKITMAYALSGVVADD